MHRKKIQIRKLLPHLTLQKKKKNKPEKVHSKFVPRRTNDPTMIAVQKSISRRRIRAIGRLIAQCHSTPSWEMQRALFLRAFRELIIRRDCRLGNGRPSTNPDETMRARLISRRAAFNANSPWFAARPSLAGNLAGSNKLDISKCFPFFTFLFSVSR